MTREAIIRLLKEVRDCESIVDADRYQAVGEAIVLLEPVEPIYIGQGFGWLYKCGYCDQRFSKRVYYCSCCGRAVKWR